MFSDAKLAIDSGYVLPVLLNSTQEVEDVPCHDSTESITISIIELQEPNSKSKPKEKQISMTKVLDCNYLSSTEHLDEKQKKPIYSEKVSVLNVFRILSILAWMVVPDSTI